MVIRSEAETTKPLRNKERLLTHLALALLAIVGCELAIVFDPSAVLTEPLSLGLGYVALLYLALSLLIGPLYLARRRRNPVNINLRRDIGIWAGITALLHVFFSFQIFQQGQILLYFLAEVRGRYIPQLNLFGFSNFIGLLAAVIVLVLLVFSNNISLRRLKGLRWKQIQRWTYPLIVLAIVHTLGYQIYNARDGLYIGTLVGLTGVVALAQGIGVIAYRRRQSRRALTPPGSGAIRIAPASPAGSRVAPAGPRPNAAPASQFATDSLSRRRFLAVGGATLVAAIAGVISFRVSEEAVSQIRNGQTLPGSPAPYPAAGGNDGATPPVPTPTPDTGGDNNAAVAPTPTPDTGGDNNAAVAPTATATTGGVVLATLQSCPLNSALNFTTPDTGESGILIHEADGSVKAFSNLCTHRPYPVDYDPGSQTLVCPLHLARFAAQTGEVLGGPAPVGLAPFTIHIDKQGNIVYG